MGTVEWDGTWCSDATAHPRGAQGPACTHSGEGQHRHYARRILCVSPNLDRISVKPMFKG